MQYLVGWIGHGLDEQLDFHAFLDHKLYSRIKRGEGTLLNKLLCVSSERFAEKLEELAHQA
ncbi:hypothetical protein ACJRO7_006320 [Eucalyptus globulus]|uniref:Uncharacterized protein n=1 Tax=Eucalyptus globulus TaxID=34317 RepID=A0ABD3II65_EUCGL